MLPNYLYINLQLPFDLEYGITQFVISLPTTIQSVHTAQLTMIC